MTYSTTVTSKGQVTIPVAIRRKLNLKPGEAVCFSVHKNGQVVVQKNDWKQQLALLHVDIAQHLQARGIQPLTDEQLDERINQAAQQAATATYDKPTI